MLNTSMIGNVHVFAPTKNLVGGDETEALKAAVADVAAHGVPRVVVDLGKIAWVSSLGLSGLIKANKTCVAHQGWLRIARPGKRVNPVIFTVRLDFYETIEGALNAPA